MLAFFFKDGEAAGLAVLRGFNSRVLVKASDDALKAKLNKLYNTSLSGLTQNFDGSSCETHLQELTPGTEQHFRYVTRKIETDTDLIADILG